MTGSTAPNDDRSPAPGAKADDPLAPLRVDPTEAAKQRRRRNLAIAGGLAAFIVLIYLVTLLRIGGSVAERSF
ncbi:MAG: hypothetical protein AAGC56_07800 [Pseudomonadota bacterium]